MPGDRTVHAEGSGMQVARYDRSGKWYLEPTNPDLPRQAVSVQDAASYAVWLRTVGGTIHLGRSGGTRFDKLVRDLEAPDAR